MPHWYITYTLAGCRYLKYEFITWTVMNDWITPYLPSQKELVLTNMIPDCFLDPGRVPNQYAAGTIADADDSIVVQKTIEHLQEVKEDFDMDDIKPFIKCDLSFPVLEQFEDPYHNNPCRLLQVRINPNDPTNAEWQQAAQDAANHGGCIPQPPKRLTIYQVNMVDAKSPKERVENTEDIIETVSCVS